MGHSMVFRRHPLARCMSVALIPFLRLLTLYGPRQSIARIPNRDLQSVMPPRNTIRQSFPRADSARQLNESLHIVLSAIDGVTFSSELEHQLCENSSSLTLVQANGNTWSRAARRKQNSGGDSMLPSTAAALLPDPPLSCRIWVLCTEDPPEKDCFDIRFQWLQGSERSLYDSFCSHVSRKIATELEMRLH